MEERQFKICKEFPATEKVVGITIFKGKVIVATERAIYAGDDCDHLEQQEFKMLSEVPDGE